jgi:hypothetical protein
MKIKALIILFFCTFSWSVSAQIPGTNSDTLRKDALNVFMEASDYIRKEIPYVNYVRDIHDAQLYIISTSQTTGSGGREYTYFMYGQQEFKGMADTLSFASSPDDTQDQVREMQVRTLKLGLMRYVAKTPLSKYMRISFTEPIAETVSTDKWNSWVFGASISGSLDGEKSYESSYLNGSLYGRRTTDNWKINLRARYNLNISKYDIGDDTYTSENRSASFNSLIVRSINDHWSYGGSLDVFSSTYNNVDIGGSIMPGIEYDLFPYSQSTRKQLRFLYSIGYNYANYTDTTIYDKLYEGHFIHSMDIAYEVIQKWGSIDISLNYSNYLYDWSKNNLSLNGFLDLRIAKGLNVSFGGGASLIHDQLGLVKGGATTEEVLLRQRQLATQFSYYTSFGFTYTFGSIYNNVVNPRFGNSSSGGMMIMYN